MFSHQDIICTVGLAALLAIGNFGARAQGTADWPTKPVRLIVNVAAGSSTDYATRAFADRLTRGLGQPFVIENRGGASGLIGIQATAKSKADGYTFLVTAGYSVVIVPHLLTAPVDPFKDLVPVTQFVDATLLLAVHPSIPASSVQELVTFAMRNPGKLSWGTSGVGSTTHLLCEGFKLRAGVDILCVPYQSGIKSLPDFLAGTVHIQSDPSTLPFVSTGKAKLLAVFDRSRRPDFPNVPLLREIYAELDFLTWLGMFAPTGTPHTIISQMSGEMNKIARDPELRQLLLTSGLAPHPGTPEDLSILSQKDYERYGKLVRHLNLRKE